MTRGFREPNARNSQKLLEDAVAAHRAGRLEDALRGYRGIARSDPRNFHALHLGGLVSIQLGDREGGIAMLRGAIKIDPNVPTAHNNCGVALLDLGRHEEALICFDHAIALQDDYLDAIINRGNALKGLGRLEEALAAFDRALARQRDHADARFNRGNTLIALERYGEAILALDAALRLQPGNPDYLQSRGAALQGLQQHREAVEIFEAVLAQRPHNVDLLINRGNSLIELGKAEEALASFDAAIALDANKAEAHNNRGTALQKLKRHEDAAASYDTAVRLRPGYLEAWCNRGGTLWTLGRYDESLASFDTALELKPDAATTRTDRANVLRDLRRYDEALEEYERAIAADPELVEPHWDKAHVSLLKGDYQHGWPEFEWRWRLKRSRPLGNRGSEATLWLGKQSLEGKTLLLTHEQGLGDTLQFVRYVPLLAKRGARVILQVLPPVARLLHDLPGVWMLIGGDQIPPRHDYHCPLMSLPLAFGTTLQTIPFGHEPYLRALPEDVQRWNLRLIEYFGTRADQTPRPRVGLVWNGGFRPDQPELWEVNERRNVPLEKFAKALDLPGVDFVSLQKGDPAESELRGREAEFWRSGRLFNAAAELKDFADTAGLVANLDLMISVDTSTAHLAAALGKPTWILNRYDTCWRWLLEREDSPWYGSVKLYRQGGDRDWTPVLARMSRDVQSFKAVFKPEKPESVLASCVAGDAAAHLEVGQSMQRLGCHEDAVAAFERVIRRRPEDFRALEGRGESMRALGREADAAASFHAGQVARNFTASQACGEAERLRASGSLEAALGCYTTALAAVPELLDARNNRGVLLLALNRPADALEDFQYAIKQGGERAEFLNNRGNALHQLRRYDEALQSFDAALQRQADDPETLVNRSMTLRSLGRFEAALSDCTTAIRVRPDYADAFFKRGNVLTDLGRLSEARHDLDAAIRLDAGHADAHWNLALLDLMVGNYSAGWRGYEWRWQLASHARRGYRGSEINLWRGDGDIRGRRLLLNAEQGLGDTLQFCRYALLALGRGARVILQVPSGLVRLLRSQPWCVEGGCEVVGLGDPLPAFDLHCPLMSLPLAFGTTVETIPYGKEAYLRAVPEDVARWSQRLDEHFAGRAADQAVTISQSARRLRVGLVWNGGFRADQPELWAVNERRNVPLEKFAKALDLPGVDFVSLQKGDPAESELRGREAEFWKSGRLFNAAAELHDFADTAGLIANLDLMISVDTSTAHLAAALGKPTWILNRYDTCWRWLLEREDSPWYGSVRLYRQGSDRDWTPVLERLAGDVATRRDREQA